MSDSYSHSHDVTSIPIFIIAQKHENPIPTGILIPMHTSSLDYGRHVYVITIKQ